MTEDEKRRFDAFELRLDAFARQLVWLTEKIERLERHLRSDGLRPEQEEAE